MSGELLMAAGAAAGGGGDGMLVEPSGLVPEGMSALHSSAEERETYLLLPRESDIRMCRSRAGLAEGTPEAVSGRR